MNICSSLNLFYISMYLNCGLITNSIYIGPDRLAMPVMGNSYYFLLIIYSLLFSKIFHFLLVNLTNNKKKSTIFQNDKLLVD